MISEQEAEKRLKAWQDRRHAEFLGVDTRRTPGEKALPQPDTAKQKPYTPIRPHRYLACGLAGGRWESGLDGDSGVRNPQCA